jgi:hypothetical protein
MQNVIVAWNNTDEVSFERKVPLLFNGERNRRIGSKTKFDVIFLYGMDLLSIEYRAKLAALGFTLVDASKSYRHLKNEYASLMRFGEYECNCFLRWLVIRDIYGTVPFVHYDADVVFNATPEEMEDQFHGLTFVLQGCPAYTRVEDSSWHENYLEELNRYVLDMEGYSNDAWRQRAEFQMVHKERSFYVWNRRLLSSDQDFFQYLIMSKRIPQAGADMMKARCSTALFQNPLGIGGDVHLPLPLTYRRIGGIDYMNDRKVAIWHMQSDFCDYLGYASFRRTLRIRGRVPWLEGKGSKIYWVYGKVMRLTSHYTRGALMHRYFSTGEDCRFLMNQEAFWQEGVFVNNFTAKKCVS